MEDKEIKVLALHWGFTPGGIAKYAASIENVRLYERIKMKSVCIRSLNWKIDHYNASKIDMDFIHIRGKYDISWIWKLRKLLKTEIPDCIFTFGFNGIFAGAFSSIGIKIRHISSWHGRYVGTTVRQKFVSPFYNTFSIIFLKYFVKNIVTVSSFSRNELVKRTIKRNKIKIIYNGISHLNLYTKRENRSVISNHQSSDHLTVGTVCRLDKTKDLFTFLKAIQIVSDTLSNINFIIWGEGPLKRCLQSYAKELKIDERLIFAGYESNINYCFSVLDIFVLPSILENFSLSLLEAMSAGLAIIATNIGGNPEAVTNNKSAILIPPRDHVNLAKGIIRFATNRKLREKFGMSAFNRFNANFTIDKMVSETAFWIKSCI
jgi:glycosyltransferase involved in cell wall biosynthesis